MFRSRSRNAKIRDLERQLAKERKEKDELVAEFREYYGHYWGRKSNFKKIMANLRMTGLLVDDDKEKKIYESFNSCAIIYAESSVDISEYVGYHANETEVPKWRIQEFKSSEEKRLWFKKEAKRTGKKFIRNRSSFYNSEDIIYWNLSKGKTYGTNYDWIGQILRILEEVDEVHLWNADKIRTVSDYKLFHREQFELVQENKRLKAIINSHLLLEKPYELSSIKNDLNRVIGKLAEVIDKANKESISGIKNEK